MIVGAVAALAILYAVRLSERSARTATAALLPRETIVFAHLPDLNRTRSQWRQSDIYQLYQEPSVQEFLRKPLERLPKRDTTAQTIQELEQLDPKDAFLAITRIDNNNPTLVGGFRYRGGAAAAETIIERWRARLLTNNRAAKREKIQYEQHQIDTITVAPFTFATAFDADWFFAANDLGELKATLYRADHPGLAAATGQDRQSTLAADKDFHAAMAHMPSGYAVSFYLQPKIFADQLSSLRAADGRNVPPDQRTMLEQIRAICGATRFERGKMRDVLFLGMPKLQDETLTRSSLALGTKDTFLYLATLLNLGQKFDALNQATGTAAVAAGWRKTLQAFARSGVTAEDWKAAFGVELGALADWPATARWPWCFLTAPVQNQTKAGKIVEALTRVDEDSTWTRTEKDGVRYFSMISPASLIAITPTIALSNRIMIIGLDPISVAEAVKHSESDRSELANSAAFENAARSVPGPTNFFAYTDTPLLYSRLDTTLRPMLLVSAAFFGWLTDYVDLTKLPPADVVTRHLTPIVSSQRYDDGGYVAESVGSITLNQSGMGLAAIGIWGSIAYQRGASPPNLNNLIPINPSPSPSSSSWTGKGYKVPNSPAPSPTGTP
jgi:hypothetical protein